MKLEREKKNVTLQFKFCDNLMANTRFVHSLRTCNTFLRTGRTQLDVVLPSNVPRESSIVIIVLLLGHDTYI